MKAIKAKIQEAAAKDGKDADAVVKAFETSAQAAAKKILGNFKDYEFYIGESMNPDGAVMLLNYREDGVTPYFTVFKDGLKSIKLISHNVSEYPSCGSRYSPQSSGTPLTTGQTKSWEELKDLDWLEPALKNYGHHIRHLTINPARIVEILTSHPHICQDLICVETTSKAGPGEEDLDKTVKEVIIDPRFGDGASQLSEKWLADNDEAELPVEAFDLVVTGSWTGATTRASESARSNRKAQKVDLAVMRYIMDVTVNGYDYDSFYYLTQVA
ncbi:hypothetical protein BGZ92_000870 [Podila epicladia]|nr:hypothetical protein BGZ92_000870 [Podila epicladia]